MKYTVGAMVTISVFTEVEADSAEKAVEIAEDRGLVGLCHQCGDDRTASAEWVTSGELDGTPYDLKATEAQ